MAGTILYLLKSLSPTRTINLIVRTTIDDGRLTMDDQQWWAHPTCTGFRLSSAARPLARPSLGALSDMSLQQPAPPGHNVPGVPIRNVSRLLQEEQPNLPGLWPNSQIWEREDTTCFSIRLDPQVPSHKQFVCNKCIRFWKSKLSIGSIPYSIHGAFDCTMVLV